MHLVDIQEKPPFTHREWIESSDFHHVRLDHGTCHPIWCMMGSHINTVSRQKFFELFGQQIGFSKIMSVCRLEHNNVDIPNREMSICNFPWFSWQKSSWYFLCQNNFIDTSIFMNVIIKTEKILALISTLNGRLAFSFIQDGREIIMQVFTSIELWNLTLTSFCWKELERPFPNYCKECVNDGFDSIVPSSVLLYATQESTRVDYELSFVWMLLELFIEELIRLVAENYLWKCETIEYFNFTLIPLTGLC